MWLPLDGSFSPDFVNPDGGYRVGLIVVLMVCAAYQGTAWTYMIDPSQEAALTWHFGIDPLRLNLLSPNAAAGPSRFCRSVTGPLSAGFAACRARIATPNVPPARSLRSRRASSGIARGRLGLSTFSGAGSLPNDFCGGTAGRSRSTPSGCNGFCWREANSGVLPAIEIWHDPPTVGAGLPGPASPPGKDHGLVLEVHG